MSGLNLGELLPHQDAWNLVYLDYSPNHRTDYGNMICHRSDLPTSPIGTLGGS